MSYSFTKAAPNKQDLMELVKEQLVVITEGQPIHSQDARQAEEAIRSYVDILPDPVEGEEVQVSVHGSVGWRNGDLVVQADIGISAYIKKSVPV